MASRDRVGREYRTREKTISETRFLGPARSPVVTGFVSVALCIFVPSVLMQATAIRNGKGPLRTHFTHRPGLLWRMPNSPTPRCHQDTITSLTASWGSAVRQTRMWIWQCQLLVSVRDLCLSRHAVAVTRVPLKPPPHLFWSVGAFTSTLSLVLR